MGGILTIPPVNWTNICHLAFFLLRGRVLNHHQVVDLAIFEVRSYNDLVFLGSDPDELQLVLLLVPLGGHLDC
eukprot:scaffold129467_cov48-Prasinocladus_malaysianus.AAC.1